MANFIQQLTLGENTYDFHDSEFILDNRTAAGAALTGVSKAPALFDGMQITYWLNYAAGTNATLNLTLADGTKTGAIPVYYSGTTRLTTHYGAGNAIRMVYRENAYSAGTARGAGWWCDANYYSDTNYDIFGASLKVDTAVYQYSLCALTGTTGTIAKQTNTKEAGTYWKVNSFTTSGGTGTSKKATTKGFIPYQILYNTSSSSYTTAGGASSTLSQGGSGLDLRYSVNGSSSSPSGIGVAGAPFFLVGTIGSDGLFYLLGNSATKEWWTCGIPTTPQTDYVYWFAGTMYSVYQLRLSDRNWFLRWSGTGEGAHLIQYETWWEVAEAVHAQSADAVPWTGVTGKPDTFTPTIGTTSTTAAAGNHTHGYIANNGSIADAVAATPASGDKIVVTDSSDSNKVKGAITIGSDDGKFLKHDGTWDTPNSGPDTPDAPTTDGNYVLNVNSGSSSWQEETKEVVEIVFDSVTRATVGGITGPVLYSSTTTYTKSLALCQDKIVKLRIPGTLIDAMIGTQGSGDVVDLVTSAGLPDNDHFAISYDTSVRINFGQGTLENEYVKGQVAIYSLDGSATGACCVSVIWLVFGQAYFSTFSAAAMSQSYTVVETPQINSGLLSLNTQTMSVVPGDGSIRVLIWPVD